MLRENNILPLPHPGHLSRMIRGISCQFGFSEFVFDELKKQFQDKPRADRQVVIMADEMKVTEAISFDKSSMKFQGYIDYGEFAEEYEKPKGSNLADHCLVIMMRCLNSNTVI